MLSEKGDVTGGDVFREKYLPQEALSSCYATLSVVLANQIKLVTIFIAILSSCYIECLLAKMSRHSTVVERIPQNYIPPNKYMNGNGSRTVNTNFPPK